MDPRPPQLDALAMAEWLEAVARALRASVGASAAGAQAPAAAAVTAAVPSVPAPAPTDRETRRKALAAARARRARAKKRAGGTPNLIPTVTLARDARVTQRDGARDAGGLGGGLAPSSPSLQSAQNTALSAGSAWNGVVNAHPPQPSRAVTPPVTRASRAGPKAMPSGLTLTEALYAAGVRGGNLERLSRSRLTAQQVQSELEDVTRDKRVRDVGAVLTPRLLALVGLPRKRTQQIAGPISQEVSKIQRTLEMKRRQLGIPTGGSS